MNGVVIRPTSFLSGAKVCVIGRGCEPFDGFLLELGDVFVLELWAHQIGEPKQTGRQGMFDFLPKRTLQRKSQLSNTISPEPCSKPC